MAVSEVRLNDEQHQQLSEILWGYRAQLHRVEVLLEAQLLFAGSGRDGQLAVLADLIEEAAVALTQLDLRRELLVHHPHDPATGLGVTPSLADLGTGADEPWAAILADHRQALAGTVQRIQQLVDQSRHTMDATLDLITQMTAGVVETPSVGYDRAGRSVRQTAAAVLFDGQA